MKRKILFNLIIFLFSAVQIILGNKVNILIDDMGVIYKQPLLDINNNNNNTKIKANKVELQTINNKSNWKGSTLNLKDPLNNLEHNNKYNQDNSVVCECKIMVSKYNKVKYN
ncbi:uncharacterized protein ELE39_002013 [Cryptosporidium sp. chipmunk genotype I]|uniref:uncharacterized protein n=1 Tax=Cryptosporidium sp. chipmunk genotype I TaxID=1280935 RepID=UPI00351A0B4A|nr:hypothetical protein ELE39_002013 [Cryptosporidium sp. chipmunk genotype I]